MLDTIFHELTFLTAPMTHPLRLCVNYALHSVVLLLVSNFLYLFVVTVHSGKTDTTMGL